MFKITLKKKDIFNDQNRSHFTSKEVTGRINKICTCCGKEIFPGKRSTTNTRKHVSDSFFKNKMAKKYVTYHTCIGACTEKFLNFKFTP